MIVKSIELGADRKYTMIVLLMRTKMNFIRRYDSIGVNGFSRFYSKIRKIQNGDYDKVIT